MNSNLEIREDWNVMVIKLGVPDNSDTISSAEAIRREYI
jgi:hypothetical protein